METNMGDEYAFCVEYNLFGFPLCRNAFIILTCLDTAQLSAARKYDKNNKLQQLCTRPAYIDTNTAQQFITALDWLLNYADSHGDFSPMDGTITLPVGYKHVYDRLYAANQEKAKLKPVSMTTCQYMWRSDCHWVKIRKSNSPFTQCDICDFLKSCAEAANNAAIKNDIIARLAMHFDFTASQMLALPILWQLSQDQHTKLLLMSHDKMDQLNTLFPRLTSMGNTGFMKTGQRLVVWIFGCIMQGVLEEQMLTTVFCDQALHTSCI